MRGLFGRGAEALGWRRPARGECWIYLKDGELGSGRCDGYWGCLLYSGHGLELALSAVLVLALAVRYMGRTDAVEEGVEVAELGHVTVVTAGVWLVVMAEERYVHVRHDEPREILES